MKLKNLLILLVVGLLMASPALADDPVDETLDDLLSEPVLSSDAFIGQVEEPDVVDESNVTEESLRKAHFAGAEAAVTPLDVSDVLRYECPAGVVPTHGQIMADLKNHGQTSRGGQLGDGTGTVVHTNASGLNCVYEVGLASYKKYDNVLYNQTLFDSTTVMIGPGEMKELQVDLPGCAVQIDFFYGPPIVEFKRKGDGNIQYWSTGIDGKDRKLGYNHPGGYTYCSDGNTEPGVCTQSLQGLNGVIDTQTLSGIANIEAVVNDRNGNTRVVFELTGPKDKVHTENHYPYYFFGDRGVDKPRGWNTDEYPEGDYLLTVKLIDKGLNTVCGSTEVRFTVGTNTVVDLESFTGQTTDSNVALQWRTASEINNAGFNIYRAMSQDGPYEQVNSALVVAELNAVSGASYSFVDFQPGVGGFYYILEDVDYSGQLTQHGPVYVTVAPPFAPQ